MTIEVRVYKWQRRNEERDTPKGGVPKGKIRTPFMQSVYKLNMVFRLHNQLFPL